LQTRLYTKNENTITALNHNINELLPTQDLDPLYEENSCLYIFTKKSLFTRHHRIGDNPTMFIMDDIESQDIDIESDFKIAEVLHSHFTK
jgi:CMP-N-acetylneuraminic acid synthetase